MTRGRKTKIERRRISKLGPDSVIVGSVVNVTLRDFLSGVSRQYRRSRSATINLLLTAYVNHPDWLTDAMESTSGTTEEE